MVLPILEKQSEIGICVCVFVAAVRVLLGEVGGRLGPGSKRVVLSLCLLPVWILCVDGRSRHLYVVLDGWLRILGAPSVQSCCTLSISAS